MSDGVKISALPAADAPTTDDVFPVVQGGVTKRLALSAASVPYGNGTVASALDQLLYVAPSASFSLSVGTVEIGSTVSSVTATWSFNKTMISATLTDTTITPADTTHLFSGLSLVSNKTYVLGFNDGTTSGSASRTVAFSPKRYWGISANTSLADADIIAMSQEFSSSKSKSVSYDCSGGKYFYFCYPSSSGLPANVTVGGLAFSDYTVSTQGFTNASGYTQNYNVVRCNNIQTGSAISVVWA